jgi:cation diffusion facilitator family transporter
MEGRTRPSEKELRESRLAMKLSLAIGFLLLLGKVAAFLLTGSMAIFSDMAESVIHQFAVVFAAFSLWLSSRPANKQFTHGYERITFFSAGFEGALIILAALIIIYSSISKWLEGLEFEHLNTGTFLVAAAAVLNLWLGRYLVKTGRKHHSMILEANGRHVLADVWTSFGVVIGLLLVLLTGWKPLDPICAIVVAVNILWSGGKLVARSVGGLMDYSDPEAGKLLRNELNRIQEDFGVTYHGLRFRHTGYRLKVELHLLFPYVMPVGKAHEIATEIEARLERGMKMPTDVVTHLEAQENHREVH